MIRLFQSLLLSVATFVIVREAFDLTLRFLSVVDAQKALPVNEDNPI
jgi:hypothetical protein